MKQSTVSKNSKASTMSMKQKDLSKSGTPAATSFQKQKQDQDERPKSILDRIKAFVNLKFTPTIDEIQYIKDPEEVDKVEQV